MDDAAQDDRASLFPLPSSPSAAASLLPSSLYSLFSAVFLLACLLAVESQLEKARPEFNTQTQIHRTTNTYIHTHAHIHAYTHSRTHTHTHTHIHIHTHTCTHTCKQSLALLSHIHPYKHPCIMHQPEMPMALAW
jgi:hypothetical protein